MHLWRCNDIASDAETLRAYILNASVGVNEMRGLDLRLRLTVGLGLATNH